MSLRAVVAVGLACTAAAAAAAGCGGASGRGAGASSTARKDVELPGVDTRDFTPREKHEFSEYVTELPAPCKDVAVPIAQCVLERRPCAACLPAAQAIAKAVRDGMAREQVEDLYKARFDASSVKTIPLDGSPSRGPLDAPVVIVEFSDFECPFCQKIAPELDALCEKHKETVRFVYKFMPLQMHPHSEIAARAAIAAQDQGKFWPMHHELFSHGEHLEPADLDAYAKAIGLDLDRFHADMSSPATKARLDADRKLADDLGVKGTPTIYIDGREYDAKIDLEDWIDQEIAAKKK
jgi:protein-disulfide isomerase